MIQNILLIATRNVVRDFRRVLGITVFVGTCLFFLMAGNSLLEGTWRGMHSAYSESFTGDMCVFPLANRNISLFGDQTPVIGELTELPLISGARKLRDSIASIPGVHGAVLQITVQSLIQIEGKDTHQIVFGVDFDEYPSQMPGLILKAGQYPEPGQEGVLLGEKSVQDLEKKLGRKLQIGEPVSLMAISVDRFEIREVPLAGIISHVVDNEVLQAINLVDAGTAASLHAVFSPADPYGASEMPAAENAVDVDAVFDDAEDLAKPHDTGTEGEAMVSLSDIETLLSVPALMDAPPREVQNAHFIVIRLEPDADEGPMFQLVRQAAASSGVSMEVHDWQAGAGSAASFFVWLRVVFNAGMAIVILTGIAIIINAVAISIIERTKEIGTMRAVGASRKFISGVFMFENMITVGGAGLIGIMMAICVMQILTGLAIPLENPALRTLFGSASLVALVSPGLTFFHVLIVVLMAAFAGLYPVWLASRINPARAMGIE